MTSNSRHGENIYLLGHAVCDVITKTLGVREELVITEMFRSQNKQEIFLYYNPPEESEGGGLKEKGQNPDSGSKNSKNQNNDAIS